MTYHIYQSSRDVVLKEGISKSLNRPLWGAAVDASSTTSRPNSIGFPLSLAIFSNVIKAFSVCPLVTWYRTDSGNH